MKYLITHALVVPMVHDGEYLEDASVGIDDDAIAFVGAAPATFRPDETIDAHGGIVMPALVDTHTHLAMELERNYKDDLPNLEAWLGEIFPIEAKLTRKDVYWASKLAFCELIQSGCTTCNDMYYLVDETARAANEAGVRAVLGITLVGDEKAQIASLGPQYDALVREVAQSDGRLKAAVAPHAVYTCSEGIYRYAHNFAQERGLLLHTHLAETDTEVAGCVRAHGATPFAWLESIGYFRDTKHVLAHCVHLSEEEADRMARYPDVSVATNPTSNAKLASGMAPICAYRRKGINVSLGTDGSSSNNNLNMFEEMHVASLVSTSLTRDITALPAYEVLKMATRNGAEALGYDTIGTLEAGKDADLILVDVRKPHLTPLNNPFSALVFAVQAGDVDTVFCKGRMLMRHRRLLTIDLEETMARTNECWKDLLRRQA